MTPDDLEALVEKMRILGVSEYTDGDTTIKLGSALPHVDEKSDQQQQRMRDLRELKQMQYQRDLLLRASSRIGPKNSRIT